MDITQTEDRRTSSDPVVTGTQEWRYEKAPPGRKVQLLTIGAVQTSGQWQGEYGQYFVAWCEVPKRNKETERQLGVLQSPRGYK